MVGSPNIPRRIAVLLVLGLACSLAAACGSSGGASESDPSPMSGEVGPGEATDPDAFPVTIEHRFGETTVDEAPARVVTVGLTDQDAVLALGHVPVGTAEWFGEQPGAIWPWATDELEGLDGERPEIVKGPDGIAFEDVAALRPDVILSVYGGLTSEEYDTLSQIAPTVAQPDGFVDWGVPWAEQTRIIGRALGRSDEAEALVADVEAQVAATREAHPELEGATGVMATVFDDQIAIYSSQDMRGRFLQSLGLEPPAEVADLAGSSFSADVSMERVDLIDGDLVVWLINDRSTDIPKFEAEPLYAQLDVHQEGRDVFVEMLQPEGAASTFITPLSIPFLLDELVPRLVAALDGDPAT